MRSLGFGFTKALTARIADLEKKLSILSATGIQRPDTEPQPIAEQTSTASLQAQVPVEKNQEFEKTESLTEFDRMFEVFEFLSDQPSLCAFLKLLKVYENGNEILLCGTAFNIEMIQSQNAEKTLVDAFSSVIGRLVTIKFKNQEDVNTDTNQVSLIEELL